MATLRHIGKEGRCFVIGVAPVLRGSDVPADVPGRTELWGGEDDWMSKGYSAIVGPEGDILAGPLVGEEGILCADLDVDRARETRYKFDPVGHYSRPDVFTLLVNDHPASVAMSGDVSATVRGDVRSPKPSRPASERPSDRKSRPAS